MEYIPTYSEFYNSISLNYYGRFLNTFKELKKMANEQGYFDVLANSPENNAKYTQLFSINREALIIAVVFHAFAIEAYVNLIAAHLYKEEEFFGNFERKSTQSKIRKIFSEKLSGDYNSHIEVKAKVDLLFTLRDRLVHFKSKKIDLEALQDDPMDYDPNEYLSDIYENIDEVMKSYELLKALLNSLIGYDVFNKQMDNLNQAMMWNIKEIYRKAFGINIEAE